MCECELGSVSVSWDGSRMHRSRWEKAMLVSAQVVSILICVGKGRCMYMYVRGSECVHKECTKSALNTYTCVHGYGVSRSVLHRSTQNTACVYVQQIIRLDSRKYT